MPSAPVRAAAPPPSQRDPVVAAASQAIGGPVGRYAAWVRDSGGLGWRVLAWAPVAAALVALGTLSMAAAVLQKSHCLRVGWKTPDQFWHACYSDIPVVYSSSGLAEGVLPYFASAGDRVLDQPVLAGLAMWLISLVTPDGSALGQQQWYFAIWAVVLTLVLSALVVVTVRCCRRAPWDAAHIALSPVLVTAGLVSIDLLALLLTAAGLWAWSRSRVVLAGILLGLAVATRSYPLVVLAAIGLLSIRAGEMRVWSRLAAASTATVAVVLLPWLTGSATVYRLWWEAGASFGSPWMVPALLGRAPTWMLPRLLGRDLPVTIVTTLTVVGWLMALLVGAILVLTSARRPTVAEVSLVMLAIVMVTGKSLPVQAALWLLPFLALVGMRWRDHLIWAGVELTSFVAVWLSIAGQTTADRGLPDHVYALIVVARLTAICYLAWQVWGSARDRPPLAVAHAVTHADGSEEGVEMVERDERDEHDEVVEVDEVVEHDEVVEVDELAGPLAGARDRLLVRVV